MGLCPGELDGWAHSLPHFFLWRGERGVKLCGICGMVEKHVRALCHELLLCWPCCQLCSQPTGWWEVMGM